MKRVAVSLLIIIFIVGFTGLVRAEDDCPGGDCGEIITVGEVWLNTDQDMKTSITLPGENEVGFTSKDWQTMEGYGLGDKDTKVSVEGQLMQYNPYSMGEELALGSVKLSGNSYQNSYATAGTNEKCFELGVNLRNEGEALGVYKIGEDSMNSKLNVKASFSAELDGAPDSLGFGAENFQTHTYISETDNGKWQLGIVTTSIKSGQLPE